MDLIQNIDEESRVSQPRTIEISVDTHFNIEPKWYERAKTDGLSESMRNFLKERICSHLLDAGKVSAEPDRNRLQGRVLELQELLGLFSV